PRAPRVAGPATGPHRARRLLRHRSPPHRGDLSRMRRPGV
ncbi:MAG: hypothetical protein AVDCRST_MAG11-1479, partial [uncultured Gemmatimonadaceae bacterium]